MPRDGWVKENREILMMQVRNTVDPAATLSVAAQVRHFFSLFFPSESLRMAGRALGMFFLIAGSVIGGGLASAQAYRDASPAGFIYSVKLAVEKAQLAVAPNDEYKAELHAEFADRRIDELAALAEQPSSDAEATAKVIVALGDELHAVGAGLDKLAVNDPAEVVRVAKLVERKMDIYRGQLAKAGQTVPLTLRPQLAKLHDLADDVTIRAMSIIVRQHLAGDVGASASIVANKIEERLKQAEGDFDAAVVDHALAGAASASKAKEAIAAAKKYLKDEDYQAALSKIVEVAQITKEVQQTEEPSPVDGTHEVSSEPVEGLPGGTPSTSPGNTVDSPHPAPAPTGSPEPSGDAAGSGN